MDDIQKKINDFRASLLEEKPPIHVRLMDKYPAVIIAAAMIFGIIAQVNFNLNVVYWMTLCAAFVVVFFAIQKTDKLLILKLLLVAGCFFTFGAVRLINFTFTPANHIGQFTQQTPRFVHIRAKITSQPVSFSSTDWLMAKFNAKNEYTTFYADAKQVKTPTGWKKITGRIKFYINEKAETIKNGDKFQTYCKIKQFAPPDNHGQFDTKKRMSRNSVYTAATLKSANSIVVTAATETGFFKKLQNKLRIIVKGQLNEDIDSDDASGLLEALLLGQRNNISSEIYNAFLITGLLHFISLSGLHVGIFVGTIWQFCRRIGFNKTVRSAICILALIIFLIIVPARTPTIRAAVMFLIFYLGQMSQRKAQSLNSLALAAIVILIIRPMDIFSIGFAMSFIAVLGILFFTEPISELLKRPVNKIKSAFISIPLNYIMTILAVGISAWAGVAGILIYHFHKIQMLSAVWTVIVFPLIFIILIGGLLKIILTMIIPVAGTVLAVALQGVTAVLIVLVKFLASIPIGQLVIGKISGWTVVCYYGLFCLLALPLNKHRKIKYATCIIMAAAIVSGFFFNSGTGTKEFQLHVLSVGAGQCIVARTANDETIIFDCGSISKNDIGKKVAVPFLDYAGINEIHTAFLSHEDTDHFNGIAEIAKQKKIENIYAAQKFIRKEDLLKTTAALMDFLKTKNIEMQKTPATIEFDKIIISKLWPAGRADPKISDNDNSEVLLIDYAGKKILLCSDIQQYAQQKLALLYPKLDVDIMIAPHHGSRNNVMENFETIFKPEYIITSCAWYQYDKIPKTGAINNNTIYFYTCRDGAVSVSINSEGQIKTETFK